MRSSTRKKYDAIFIWQQMVAYILFEIKRFTPFKLPPVVFFTFIYNSDRIFSRYKKHMVRTSLKYTKGIIWDSEETVDAVKKDFPIYGLKNHYVPHRYLKWWMRFLLLKRLTIRILKMAFTRQEQPRGILIL